ncbi:flavin reductase family protein [Actinoplanes sp. NPDC051861]|uniref:flavin reductase family protein n=1 Tax=Actinoplanes sp. NPDC051861 TaxID=3155170 RepID=UPI0034219253
MNQQVLREVMAAVPTPVSVVTTMTGSTAHGSTVSAFVSLSMDPPMVLVSLARSSNLLRNIRSSGRYGVNVLSAEQAALAIGFATAESGHRFRGVRWSADHDLPRLAGTTGWLACEVAGLIDGGDHVIVLGRVVGAETAEAAPLVYHRRTFGTHLPA